MGWIDVLNALNLFYFFLNMYHSAIWANEPRGLVINEWIQ